MLLKTALRCGSTEIIRKLHALGVRADIQTVERERDGRNSRSLYIFRDLKDNPHLAKVMPVLQELYPQEAARYQRDLKKKADPQPRRFQVKALLIGTSAMNSPR